MPRPQFLGPEAVASPVDFSLLPRTPAVGSTFVAVFWVGAHTLTPVTAGGYFGIRKNSAFFFFFQISKGTLLSEPTAGLGSGRDWGGTWV